MYYVNNEVPYYQFDNLRKFSDTLIHGISTRKGGVSKGYLDSLNFGLEVGDEKQNVMENYRRFSKSVGFNLRNLAIAFQEHSDNILILKERPKGLGTYYDGVDGFMTNLKNVPLMVRFADCQGALLFDPKKKVIAAVHSGWRGNTKNILGKAIQKMILEFGSFAADIVVGISPSLGPCCSEFSDPFNELPKEIHKYVDEKNKVDLWKCSLDQLIKAGVPIKNIEIARRCTVCGNNEFFSFRGGKRKTGHMAGAIELI